MVKSYLKYEASKTFGLVASASSNAVWAAGEDHHTHAHRATGVGRALVGANEEVLCWDLKKGDLLSRWKDPSCNAEVTSLASSRTDTDIYAVGYDDGTIRLWDSRTATIIITFNGHKTAVTTLVFDGSGARLASGAKDTDIIIWDLIGEVGLFKLRGHKDQITGLQFLDLQPVDASVARGVEDVENSPAELLVSAGKDALLKLWNLEAQYCVETHVTQSNGQCWALAVSTDRSVVITAGNEGELKFWGLNIANTDVSTSDGLVKRKTQVLVEKGTLYRRIKDRTVGVHFHPRLPYIAVHGNEKLVEVWRMRSEGEIQKKLARKRKRRREKTRVNDDDKADGPIDTFTQNEDISMADIDDVIAPCADIRPSGRIRSVSWVDSVSSKTLRILVAQANNQLEVWNTSRRVAETSSGLGEDDEPSRSCAIELPGHRTDVRALTISSDGRMLASAGQGALKIWNLRTSTCIRTLECGFALCASFLPGDRIVLVGTRQGELELFDIASAAHIETLKIHDEKIWSLHVHPDGKSLITGSEDKSAKFFKFDVVQEQTPNAHPKLKLVHIKTLKVNDAILCIRFSPDARLIAFALLDNTVRIHFADSLKLFHNLYGHKLPVLSLDVSYDSKMIVTCSADKNVRLWGLDFGDCHKAIFAHQDNITQVAFIPQDRDGNGHQFFSASKDHLLKYWDGDKFEQIQKLEGHHGEIWAMAISHNGDFVVTAGHDKSIRVWNETDEQIFLEEEREKEFEQLHESTLAATFELEPDGSEQKAEVTDAGKQTIETLMAGEKIAEAIDKGTEDMDLMKDFEQARSSQPNLVAPIRDPIYLAQHDISAEGHLLNVTQKVKAAALEDALLVLSFDRVCSFLVFLQIWAKRYWNMPLTCRITFFLLKTHHKQLVASKKTRILLDDIRSVLRNALHELKDEIGFNLAALRFVERRSEESRQSGFIGEELYDEEVSSKDTKKRGFLDIA